MHRSAVPLIALSAAGLLAGGCSITVNHEGDVHRPHGMPGLRFEPGERFTPEPELAESLGGSVQSVYITDTADSNSRVIVSFDERTRAANHASLNAFAANVDASFRGAYPDRALSILDVDGADRLTEAGYPYVVLAYGHHEGGAAKPSSICDAAALLIEAPDGYWTVSWNATRGTLADSKAVLADFLAGAEIPGYWSD